MPELNHEYYCRRAQRARELADAAHDDDIREIHRRMAKDYSELAELNRAHAPLGWASD